MSRLLKLKRQVIAEANKRVLNEQEDTNKLYGHILMKYIEPHLDKNDIDDFGDEFDYYDNVITWGVADYISAEAPERSDDYDYQDELEDEMRDWWAPI